MRYWSATSVVGSVAAGAVPADGHPDGVADEAVDELDVEVAAQRAGLDALGEQPHPHVAGLRVALGEVAEPLEGAEVVGLVLEDRDLVRCWSIASNETRTACSSLVAGVVVGGQDLRRTLPNSSAWKVDRISSTIDSLESKWW